MTDEAQVTATEYTFSDELRDLLAEVGQNATVSYGEEQEIDLSGRPRRNAARV